MKNLLIFLLLLVSSVSAQNQIIEFCDDSITQYNYYSIHSPNCNVHWSFYKEGLLLQNFETSEVSIRFPSEGKYTIELYIDNNFCQSKKQIFDVDVIECRESILLIPTAFTPNDDGLNDKFFVEGSFISEIDIEIYNRWGELIFHTNDITLGWDGKNAQTGVYVVKVSYKNVRGIKDIKCSTLVLYK